MPDCVLITGSTSGIGLSVAHRFAERGDDLVIAGRDEAELLRHRDDLQIRYGVEVATVLFDAADLDGIEAWFHRAVQGGSREVTGIVMAHGVMHDQAAAEQEVGLLRNMIDVNFTSVVMLGTLAAAYFKDRGDGFVSALTSVAGERGRQSNAVYGATKAGAMAFLSGLRNRHFPDGVHVSTIIPGIVDTPMTWGLVDPSSPLVGDVDQVAKRIVKSVSARRDVTYAPAYWWPIMLIIRSIPEPIFKRLRL